MQGLQNQDFLSSDSTAMDELQDFMRRCRYDFTTCASSWP
jgi:hypothetical protein